MLGGKMSLPGLVLVIVIAWALAAVMMLTGTLVNAREIDDRVELINTQVTPIDKDLDAVRLAEKTNRTASKISAAAAPLSRQLGQVIATAQGIDSNANSILSTAGDINATAGDINATVRSINTTVRAIEGNVFSISANLASTLRSVLSINDSATSINANVAGVNAAVNGIRAKASVILDSGESIDSGVAAINGRAARAIDVVRGLKADFDGILKQVGLVTGSASRTGSSRDAGIRGHVGSIDCAPLLNSMGPTQHCGD